MEAIQLTFLGEAAGARLVDTGRPALGRFAIATGGPVDRVAFQQGAALLGNEYDQPAIELPLRGGHWRLEGRGVLAVTGANMHWALNSQPISGMKPYEFSGPTLLASKYASDGQYGYLHVSGEWQLPREFGSAEALVIENSSLPPGWTVTIEPGEKVRPLSSIESAGQLKQSTVTFTSGLEWLLLQPAWRNALQQPSYHLSPQSNRQGLRLQPTQAFNHFPPLPRMISSPVLPGTLQFTGSEIIVLGPDAQTVGGYPRLGWVDETTLGQLYQIRLGTQIRLFAES